LGNVSNERAQHTKKNQLPQRPVRLLSGRVRVLLTVNPVRSRKTVEVFQTKAGKFVAEIYDTSVGETYIETANDLDRLIAQMKGNDNHENDEFMSALAKAFPDRELWVEQID
jgi:hypothetical protein